MNTNDKAQINDILLYRETSQKAFFVHQKTTLFYNKTLLNSLKDYFRQKLFSFNIESKFIYLKKDGLIIRQLDPSKKVSELGLEESSEILISEKIKDISKKVEEEAPKALTITEPLESSTPRIVTTENSVISNTSASIINFRKIICKKNPKKIAKTFSLDIKKK